MRNTVYTLNNGTIWNILPGSFSLSYQPASLAKKKIMFLEILQHNYTGCNGRKGPGFGRVFLMLNYTEKPQNTYIQS